MTDSIRIAQITDCHLPADPKQQYRGINPRDNLNTLLQKVKDLAPNLVLASGDLSEDGSRISYLALQQYWWVIMSLLASLLVFLMFVQDNQELYL